MSGRPHARILARYGIRFAGLLLIVFLVIQLAPGGPVDRFFFGRYERSLGGSGPIR
jgi:ABC-type microcin C transport system permease subunit YejB